MKAWSVLWLTALVVVMSIQPLAARGDVPAQQPPTIKIPESGVPQIMTIEGTWVRAPVTMKATPSLDIATPTCRSARIGCSSSSAQRFAMVCRATS